MGSSKSAGGWHSIGYTLRTANRVGWVKLAKAMLSKNACKTCALGMGGQLGGMKNELGHFPEFCKKSLQAVAADMQRPIPESTFKERGISELKNLSPHQMEHLGRLSQPILLEEGATHYRIISWETAIDKISKKLTTIDPLQAFFYFSGRSSNEAGFLLQLFARLYGTNHINNCSYYCHQASGVGLSQMIGTGTATIQLEDLEKSDCFLLFGGNPSSNHPRLLTSLMRLRNRGGQVIVVNPAKEKGLVNFKIPSNLKSLFSGTEIASHYLQPHIGGDIALMIGLAKTLQTIPEAVSQTFLKDHTEGWGEVKSLIDSTSWEAIETASGVTRSSIEEAATTYARSKNAVFGWTMGITHHQHGVENVQWIVNLALMRAMVGKPNAGLLPIRGHSNVQGMGTIGVTPQLKKELFARWQTNGLNPPASKGLDTMACVEASDRNEMKFACCLGGNLYGSNPDAAFASQAMAKLDLIVYMNTSLNTGHARGLAKETLVLPVLARDEDPQASTQESMFNFVRFSDGGKARFSGPRSESVIISQIAQKVLGDSHHMKWSTLQNHQEIRQWIAKLIPGLEKLSEIEKSKKEFHIPGRIYHQPKFSTPHSKAILKAHPIPKSTKAPDSFLMMSVRSEGQFNTVVYEIEDKFRGQTRRDVVLMHPQDIQKLNLKENDSVMVKSKKGQMGPLLLRPFDIRPGNIVMYYPECNGLIGRKVDPQSKTPSFKNTEVWVQPTQSNSPF